MVSKQKMLNPIRNHRNANKNKDAVFPLNVKNKES